MKNELMHHGIKGQRWGVRRYQNSDGSLTSEGRRHYGFGERMANTGRKIRDYMTVKDENGKRHLSEKGKKAVEYSLIGIGAVAATSIVAAKAAKGLHYFNKLKNDQTFLNGVIDKTAKDAGMTSWQTEQFRTSAYNFLKPKMYGSFKEVTNAGLKYPMVLRR